MSFRDEVESFFDTKDLYEVLGISKEANETQIKKAYRKVSLKVHPDRVDESEKEQATKKFQVLARVHFILSDPERRKLYDEHGIIANEDGLESEADWNNYWRLLFPKISEKDIKNFLDTYIASKDEEADLIALYNKYEGDMDKLCQTHISFDEERTSNDLNRLIEEGKIEKFDKFTKEPESKKLKRKKRAQREAKQAEKAKKERSESGEPDISELTAMIQRKSEKNFNSMIANLEAKYSKKSAKTSGTKRKRSDRD